MKDYDTIHLKVLVYGPLGVGKTRFAATFPKPIFIDIEDGLLSVRDILPPETKVFKVRTFEDMLSAIETVKKSTEYETVIVDSFTAFSRYLMDSLLVKTNRDKPSRDEYERVKEMVRRTVLRLKDLRLHVVFICLDDIRENELTKETFIMPALIGKTAKETGEMLDEVFYMSIRGNEAMLLTRPSGIIQAKDRSGRLAMYEKPDFKTIFSKLTQSKAIASEK